MYPFDAPDYSGMPAINYLRVSDKSQKIRGDGLNSQDTKTRAHAAYLGCEIIRTFRDDISGKYTSRSGVDDMLAFLKANRKAGPYVVIVDDISRIARNIRAHWDLRDAVAASGGIMVSPNMVFRDDADSRHFENMQASSAEHFRLKNAETTKSRMIGRLMNGYWPFTAPTGYKHVKIKGIGGKVIVRDEPIASILQEALKGFASGRFETQMEVARFLESFPDYPKTGNNAVHVQRVKDILTRPIYAGYVGYEPWAISLIIGQHGDSEVGSKQNLITLAEFEKIQERLQGKAKAPARKNMDQDFPLRGAVECGDCGTPLTSCWTKGRSAHYPYYLCHGKGCASYGKSIRRDELEGEFEALLGTLKPTPKLFEMAKAMLEQVWEYRLETAKTAQSSAKQERRKLEKQVEGLLDRIVEASTPSVITAYEKRIAKLEREKLLLAEKASKTHQPLQSFDDTLRTAMQFWSNPQKLWASGKLEHRRTLLKLMFEHRLQYIRNQGLRTAKTTLPFKVLGDMQMGNFRMVPGGGFEPPTRGFSIRCSTPELPGHI